MRSGNVRLVALLVAAVLPVVAIASTLVLYVARQERRAVEAETRAEVTRLVDLVDRELRANLRVLEALATSTNLDGPDLPAFHDEARRALASQPGWLTVVLLGLDGWQLLSARQPFDRPPTRVVEPRSYEEVLRTGRPAIGSINLPSPLSPAGAVPVRVPVTRGDAVRYVLTAPVTPASVGRLLREAGIPTGWVGVVADRDGRIVARSPDPERYVGRSMNEYALAAVRSGASSGLYTGKLFDGTDVVAAFGTAGLSGWTVHLGVPREVYDAPRRRAIRAASLGGVASVLLAAALAWLVQRDVAARRRQDAALRQAQAMEAIGRMTGGVAHDFNNMLAVVRSSAELLRRRPNDPRREFFLDGIVQATERGATLTRQLLSFAGRRASRPEVLDLAGRVAAVAELVRPSLRGGVELRVELAPGLWPVEADPGELELALLNLVANAGDAMPEGGVVRIAAGNLSRPPRPGGGGPPGPAGEQVVRLSVADTGAGMAPEVAERAFEPFFTTKERGKGTGLGLSQVYGFARQAGGTATIRSRPGAGTTVELHLPRARAAPAPAGPTVAEEPAPAGRRLRVLVVEDDAAVAASTAALLEQLGHTTAATVDRADAALGALARGDGPFDLVLSDIVMPGATDGIGLARELRRRFPDLPVLLATGYSAEVESAGAGPLGVRVLRKPFGARALHEAIEATLGGTAPATPAGADAGAPAPG